MEQSVVIRYQPKKHVATGSEWYRMFFDLPHKWQTDNRFAGRGVGPGHFFSLTRGGALAELSAYGADAQDYCQLLLMISIDNLLNLTDANAVSSFYRNNVKQDMHETVVLDYLLHQGKGGSWVDDFVAHRALQLGYNGIVYFGARTACAHWPDPGTQNCNINLSGIYWNELQNDPNYINVVIFFGHNVVKATHAISADRVRTNNMLYGRSFSEIDSVFMADATKPENEDLTYEALRSRADRIHWKLRSETGS